MRVLPGDEFTEELIQDQLLVYNKRKPGGNQWFFEMNENIRSITFERIRRNFFDISM